VPGPDEIDPQARQLHNVGCATGAAAWLALGGLYGVLSIRFGPGGAATKSVLVVLATVACFGLNLALVGLQWIAWRRHDEIWVWAFLNFFFGLAVMLPMSGKLLRWLG
jgi:hypothetical protein